MRRFQDTRLFLPLRLRLAPQLPWEILVDVLGLSDEKYTFLTPEAQLHVSLDHFIPISGALGVPLPKEDFQMEPVETPAVPIPAWEPPVDMACDSGRVGSENPEEDTKEKGLFRRLFAKSSKSEKPRSEAEIKTADPVEAVEEGPKRTTPVEEKSFLQYAESFAASGDHLSAAVLYNLGGDNISAARCFRAAAEKLKTAG